MEPSQSSGNVSSSEVILSQLERLSRLALNCPEPKPKSSSYFFSKSTPSAEPLTVTEVITTFWTDVFSVLFTCLSAYLLQWLINYFLRFIASLAFVLSGADNTVLSAPPSAPPSPSKSPSVTTAVETTDPQKMVRMNEPVDCSVRLPSSAQVSSVSLGTRDTYRRMGAGSEEDVLEELAEDTIIAVYADQNELCGSFTLEQDGRAEFIWLDSSCDVVSVTGSFLGFSLSLPLNFNEGYFRQSVRLPPGDHQYQFIFRPENEEMFLDAQ